MLSGPLTSFLLGSDHSPGRLAEASKLDAPFARGPPACVAIAAREFISNGGVSSATPPVPHCILNTLIFECPPLPRTCLGMGSRTPAPALRPSPAHSACLRVPPSPPHLSPGCPLALIGSCCYSALILETSPKYHPFLGNATPLGHMPSACRHVCITCKCFFVSEVP